MVTEALAGVRWLLGCRLLRWGIRAAIRARRCARRRAAASRPAASSSAVPARPLKAWEACRCPAKAPGPERQSASWVVLRRLRGRRRPAVPHPISQPEAQPAQEQKAEDNPHLRARGQRHLGIVPGAPPVPRLPALLYQSIRAYPRINRPSALDFPAILLLSSMPLDRARKREAEAKS